MSNKIRVAVLCGGVSAEHEISLISAVRVLKSLPEDEYETSLLVISKKGSFHKIPSHLLLAKKLDPRKMQDLLSVDTDMPYKGLTAFFSEQDPKELAFDVVIPTLHGPMGEDGAIQGLVKALDLPCAGADVLGSALGMDKEVSKRVLQAHGIKTAQFACYLRLEDVNYESLEQDFGYPMFVKPASLGSSIGIAKAKNRIELKENLQNAFHFDTKVIVEKAIHGREIECCVLEQEQLRVSLPCEIVPQCEFHSYESKYFTEKAARMDIPAKLDQDKISQVQRLSKQVFQVLCCEAMARIDFFLTQEGDFIVNEINTIPGMTPLSPFPLLWEEEGVLFAEVTKSLINHALKRHAKRKMLALVPEEVSVCALKK